MLVTLASDTGNTPGELRTVISQAQNGDTIKFAQQIYGDTITLNPNLGQINLNPGFGKSLTIDGTGSDVFIDGGNNGRIFEVQSGTVTITSGTTIAQGLTLQHGKVIDENGGAILVDQGATLNANYVEFANNHAVRDQAIVNGGAIEDDGTVNVTGCFFINNAADTDGGAINASGDSTHTVKLTVSGSDFYGNQAPSIAGSGGAIKSTAAVTNIQSSTFDTNSAGFLGGAITYGIISNATPPTGYSSTFAVNQDYFVNNTVGTNGLTGEGGAIFIVNNVNSGTITMSVTNSTFYLNKAQNFGAEGGAVSINDTTSGAGGMAGSTTAQFINDTFFTNTSDDQGGALWVKAVANAGSGANTLELTSLTVNQNSAVNNGGGVYLDTVRGVSVDNNIFDGNRVTVQGFNGPLDVTLVNGASLNDIGYNLVGRTDTMFTNDVNHDIVNDNPGLAPALAQNGAPAGYPPTLALLAGPGLGSGDNRLVTKGIPYKLDERGMFRPATGVSRGAEDPNATSGITGGSAAVRRHGSRPGTGIYSGSGSLTISGSGHSGK